MEVIRGVQIAVLVATVVGIGVGSAMLSRSSSEPVIPIELAVDDGSGGSQASATPPASDTERTEDGDADGIVTPDVREDVPPPSADRVRQPRADGTTGETARPADGGTPTDGAGRGDTDEDEGDETEVDEDDRGDEDEVDDDRGDEDEVDEDGWDDSDWDDSVDDDADDDADDD